MKGRKTMNRTIAFSLLSIYFGTIGTIITKNIYYGFAVFAVFIAVSLLFICPTIKKSETTRRKKHEVFHFINNFIVSLTITSSLDQAFEDATLEIKGEEKEVVKGIAHLSTNEKLDYLALYYDEDIYRVFLSVVKLYQEQGGNLLDIASPLLDEAALNEEKQNSMETQKKKSIIQFSSMWFLSSLILCFLRYGLSSFYDILVESLPYLLTSVAYFLIAIFSFCMYAKSSSQKENPSKKEAK